MTHTEPVPRRQWYRNSLLVGVVGSLIASILLQPLLNLFGRWLLNQTGPVIQFFRDAAFRHAPEELAPQQLEFIKFIFYVIFFYCLIGSTILLFIVRRANEGFFEPTEYNFAKINTINSINAKFANVAIVVGTITAIVFAGTCFIDHSMDDLSFSANESFQRNIQIISPFISGQQEKIFRSQYASIDREQDFRTIATQIDLIAINSKKKLRRWPWSKKG